MTWTPYPLSGVNTVEAEDLLCDRMTLMVSHVFFLDDAGFYEWRECSGECAQFLHDASSAALLNSYPQEWVEELLGFTIRADHRSVSILFLDENGEYHREDGPALWDGFSTRWYWHGSVHCVDGPAVVIPDLRREEWWLKGVRHRVDGPAFVQEGSREEWWVNGKLHRVDGPARMKLDMDIAEWWIDDEFQYSHSLVGTDMLARLKLTAWQ